jgi:carbamoyl-phosphate synthase large subunit
VIIASGPIIIGQAREFDSYSSQAYKALRAEGYDVTLGNPNPATIMTDPELAGRAYLEPLTLECLGAILERQSPMPFCGP